MKQKFSAAGLKTLAVIAMTVDHTALLFVPQDSLFYWLMRMFGRLTAPIMAFFIAEGFQHTSSRSIIVWFTGKFWIKNFSCIGM